ncbi:unnamed protein product [Chrysodeixis includens]|uniref:Uncharacterized protein n=1 Tax=Chrysodeixis includens TaxID=689277 RepID=A0A9N8L5I5_CHRIL|nr:unnamed protein product [Chrysodeixis includens]
MASNRGIQIGSAWFQRKLNLRPQHRGVHLVTEEILKQVPELSQFAVGLCHIQIMHTSASLALNESWDPDVRDDMEMMLNKIVPEGLPYRHSCEGPDDMPAHVKACFLGSSLTIPITDGKLNLGTWQGGSDAVGLPARLAAVARVGRVVFQLGKGGGRDPPHTLSLAPLLQKHAEELKALRCRVARTAPSPRRGATRTQTLLMLRSVEVNAEPVELTRFRDSVCESRRLNSAGRPAARALALTLAPTYTTLLGVPVENLVVLQEFIILIPCSTFHQQRNSVDVVSGSHAARLRPFRCVRL